MIDRYRRRPLYSADNEDTRSELRALAIRGSDTVVAIAAGGGRALSLLSAEPHRLVAIDRRADQLFNLELKAAAMHAFDLGGNYAFLGLAPSRDRLDRYSDLRASLSPSARRYWDNRRSLLEQGVYFAGRLETGLVRIMKLLRERGRMDWAEPLFRADSIEAQRALIHANRDRIARGLRWVRFVCHPLVIYPAVQDPGFVRSTQGSAGDYLVGRLFEYAESNLVSESSLLRMIYDCTLTPSSPLPPYLTPGGFDLAKKQLDKLEFQCSDLRDFATRARYSGPVKWSLSDVSCWMHEDRFHDVLRRVTTVGDAGSRICYRNFAAKRSIPADLRQRVIVDTELSDTLSVEDSSVMFSIVAARYGDAA